MLNDNEMVFDSFHYGVGGYVYSEVGCILDMKYPQPYRTSFSCTLGPSHYFPSLGTECQELYTYGSPGRSTVDARCRPMPDSKYEVGVEAWNVAHPHLSAMCQVCPPYNCQMLMYPDLHLIDDTSSAASKTKKKSKLNKSKSKKSISSENRTKHLRSEMRLHKDNGHQDDITGKHRGGNVDKEMNSHILGSDVMMVTIGDTMDFHLVRPNYANQNYKFTQKAAINNKKSTNISLTKTVPLSHGSLYVHTAHDDEMYYHGLDFVKEHSKRNRVRVVLVFWWLSVPSFFRQSSHDDPCNRYSTVDKHAFEKLYNNKKGNLWFNALGYLDKDGKNTVTQLMDPIPPPTKKGSV